MAQYYYDPVWAVQLVMALMYVVFVWIMVHAAIGVARTVVVRLPLRLNRQGAPVELLSVDYSPRLRQFDDSSRKALKIMVYLLGALFFCAAWTVVVISTFYARDPLFGWTLLNDTVVAAIHVVLVFGAIALGARYGVRTAKRYEMASPFVRLDEYLTGQLREGSEGRLNKVPVRHELNHPVYELTLPGGAVVKVCMEGESVRWFEIVVASHGDIRFTKDDVLRPGTLFSVNRHLAVNGI